MRRTSGLFLASWEAACAAAGGPGGSGSGMCRSRGRARSDRARGRGRGAVRRPVRCAASFQGRSGRRRTGCRRSAGTIASPLQSTCPRPGRPRARLAGEGGGGGCQLFLAGPAGPLSQRRMFQMRLTGPLRHGLGAVQVASGPLGRPGHGGTGHRRIPPSAVVCRKARCSGSRRGGEAPGADHRSAPGSSVRGCRVLVSWPGPSGSDLFDGVRTGQERRNQGSCW